MWKGSRMQVEVSKHTEGKKEKVLRPNGLPESLIRYDGQFSLHPIMIINFLTFVLWMDIWLLLLHSLVVVFSDNLSWDKMSKSLSILYVPIFGGNCWSVWESMISFDCTKVCTWGKGQQQIQAMMCGLDCVVKQQGCRRRQLSQSQIWLEYSSIHISPLRNPIPILHQKSLRKACLLKKLRMWWQHLCHNKGQALPYGVLHSLLSLMEFSMHPQKSFQNQKVSPSLQMFWKVFLTVTLVNEDIGGPLVFCHYLGTSTFPKLFFSKPGSILLQVPYHCSSDSLSVIARKGICSLCM